MKLALTSVFFGLVTVFAVGSVGCSTTSSDSSTPEGPVAATPLTGTINGASFTAKSAITHVGGFGSNSDGTQNIDIYETDVTCADFAPQADREILLSVPWKDNTDRDFKLAFGSPDSQTGTFVIQKNGTPDNIISTQGRVEIITAPTDKDAMGKMRLRMSAEGNTVEGEVDIHVCVDQN
jgi:hypothetical protein